PSPPLFRSPRPRLLRPAPQRRHPHPGAGALDPAPHRSPRRRYHGAADGGRDPQLAGGGMSELSFGEGLDTLTTLGNRFRGFLPVVVDVETGGFNAREHALLEIAAVTLDMTEDGQLVRRETIAAAVIPHPDLAIEQAALDFTGINPADPNRQALPEKEALNHIFHKVRE